MIRALLSHAFGPLCAVASSIFPNAAGILVALAVAWSDGPVSHLYSRWSGSCEVTARLGLRQATKKTTMKFWQEDPAHIHLAKEAKTSFRASVPWSRWYFGWESPVQIVPEEIGRVVVEEQACSYARLFLGLCYQKDRARPLTVSDKEGLLDGGGGLGLGLWTKVHKPSFAGEDDSEVPSALLLGRHDERRTPWSVYRSSRRAEVVVCFGDDDPTAMAVETADAYGALRAISRSVTKDEYLEFAIQALFELINQSDLVGMNFVVIGHSLGGLAAIAAAVRFGHDPRFKRFIALSPAMAVLPASLIPSQEGLGVVDTVGCQEVVSKLESWLVSGDPLSYGNDSWGWQLGWPCGASYVLPPPAGLEVSPWSVGQLIGLHSHTIWGPFAEEG